MLKVFSSYSRSTSQQNQQMTRWHISNQTSLKLRILTTRKTGCKEFLLLFHQTMQTTLQSLGR